MIENGPWVNISPEDFFTYFIVQRRPYKFTTSIGDPEFKVNSELWTDEYLKTHTDDTIIQVEQRHANNEKFGKGNEIHMTFRDFLNTKDSNLYLTTQELVHDPEGRPAILSPPLNGLKSDFPWRPKIMGNLIPQNINLWMGFSTNLTSSGLHHDYHDNLYILLRGTKQFTLYHYNEHPYMYVNGDLLLIHTNGRINYVGQPTRADGSHLSSEDALMASQKLQEAVLKLHSDSENEEAEDEIEQALEDALNAEMDGDDDFENDDDDEYDNEESNDEDEELGKINKSNTNRIQDEEKKADESGVKEGGREVELIPLSIIGAIENTLRASGAKRAAIPDKSSSHIPLKKSKSSSATSSEPPSFSRVNTDLPDTELAIKFPKFLEAKKRSILVTVNAGEMLYIPAGWFHEVRSVADDSGSGHMALNYWFHPPDGNTFEKPYKSDFWAKDWAERDLQ